MSETEWIFQYLKVQKGNIEKAKKVTFGINTLSLFLFFSFLCVFFYLVSEKFSRSRKAGRRGSVALLLDCLLN
jgi:hypothetical protein